MKALNKIAVVSVTAAALASISASAFADNANCSDINDTFKNPATIIELNKVMGEPIEGNLDKKGDNQIILRDFEFVKLKGGKKNPDGGRAGKLNCDIRLKAQATKTKNGKTKFVKNAFYDYRFSERDSKNGKFCFQFKNEDLKGASAKKFLEKKICVKS